MHYWGLIKGLDALEEIDSPIENREIYSQRFFEQGQVPNIPKELIGA